MSMTTTTVAAPATGRPAPVGIKAKGRSTYLPVSCMEMDPQTQRKLNRAWVKARVSDFDPELFGSIVISLRMGRYLIVDGQHRVELLRLMGWGDQKVPCLLYEGLTLAEEAALFIGLAERRNARTFDRFRISIVAGDKAACDIDRIVRAQGLCLSDQKKDGAIAAVGALGRVYEGAGLAQSSPATLGRTLKLLKAAWGTDANAYEGPVILGAGLVLLRYSTQVDDVALAGKLAKHKGGPSGLVGSAKGLMEIKRRPLGHCLAACIVDAYNAGRPHGEA
jgi:hypothetical protein